MSSASDFDAEEEIGSPEKLPENEADEVCANGGDASEDHNVPRCFDTSKLKEELRDKMEEPLEAELDFEEEIHEKEDKEDVPQQKDTEGECEEDEPKKPDDSQDEHEEGEADEGEVTDEDDLEEGEVKDGSSNRKLQPRPICRFFNKGQCTWGTSCRFIHPGVNDKGNYNMFAPPKPSFGPNSNIILPVPPPPMMMMMMGGPGHNFLPRIGMRGPDVAFPPAVEEAAPVESAWERGLRHAKEILKKASRRKEQEPDFEEKRMNLSIDSTEKGPEFDKENDYYSSRSPQHRRSEAFNYSGKFEESSDRESREVWRSGRYENFEVRWPRQDFDSRERSNKDRPRPRYQRSYDREKYDRRSQDEDRYREDRHSDNPTRGDEWRDPWRRSKTPKGRDRSRGRSRRRSYSSESSHSFSSRSSRSSYSYSRSSSSKSSYYSSDSYSKSRSRSPFSRLDSRSPPTRPRTYARTRNESSRRRHRGFRTRSSGRRSHSRTTRSPPTRSARSPPLRAARSPPLRVNRSPPLRAARSPPPRSARSPPSRSARSPPPRPTRSPPSRSVRSPPLRAARSPIRMLRRKQSPGKDVTKQIPLPPPTVPTTATQSVHVPSANETSAENPPDARVSIQKSEKRGRLSRSYSRSDSSRSLSRSVSRSSSSASRSRSRSRSRSISRSGSYSRSISMSSVSSVSGSDTSSDSHAKRTTRSPAKESTPKPEVRKYEEKGESKIAAKVTRELSSEAEPEPQRPKEKPVPAPKAVEVVAPAPREKKISMVLPKQLQQLPTIPLIPKQSKDLLRQSGQKPQIKLTLLSKAPPAPSPVEQSSMGKDVLPQKAVGRDEAASGLGKDTPTVASRKRPLSPSAILAKTAAALPQLAAAAAPGKRSTTSRREELLKQLKAVEDAIARKRAKII